MKKLVRITIELDTEHPVEAINKAIKAGVADTAWLNKDCVRSTGCVRGASKRIGVSNPPLGTLERRSVAGYPQPLTTVVFRGGNILSVGASAGLPIFHLELMKVMRPRMEPWIKRVMFQRAGSIPAVPNSN